MVYVVNSETSEQWEVDSVHNAFDFLRDRELVDPDGVFEGIYHIDNTEAIDGGSNTVV